jgi:hypothetical protein
MMLLYNNGDIIRVITTQSIVPSLPRIKPHNVMYRGCAAGGLEQRTLSRRKHSSKLRRCHLHIRILPGKHVSTVL